MRDYKGEHKWNQKGKQKGQKVRVNRRKQQPKPLNLRKILHRTLRVTVALFSVVAVVVGGFLTVQMVMASDQFRVETISVQGNKRLDGETVVALSDIEPGIMTFHLDLHLIGRKIEENPWIKQARIQRIFPRQVVIAVVEREPVAIVNLGYLYYVDADGEVFKVLEGSDSLDFAMVTGFDALRLGEGDRWEAEKMKQVVSLLKALKQRKYFNEQQVSEVSLEAGGGLSVYALEGVRIRFGQGDYEKKLSRLERIYAHLKPKMTMLEYIDLNVDEKVIVRIEQSPGVTKI